MTFENEKPNELKLVEEQAVTVQDTMNELADIQIAQKKIISERKERLEIIKGGDPTLIAIIQRELDEAEQKLDDATNKLRPLLQKRDEKYLVEGWNTTGASNGNTSITTGGEIDFK